MTRNLKAILIATTLGLSTVGYATAQAPHHPDPAQPPPPGHAGMPGMEHGGMDMMSMHCMSVTDARLATLKHDLDITPRQERAWNAFAAAVGPRPMAHRMGPGMGMGMGPGMGMKMDMSAGSLPERMRHHEMMMKEHLRKMQGVRAAVQRLYAVLTPAQRTKADAVLCPGMGSPPR